MKSEHKKWVEKNLSQNDLKKQIEDERYAEIIDYWFAKAKIDDWLLWTINVLYHGDITISGNSYYRLMELRNWLSSRIWSRLYPELDASFENFGNVLRDFLSLFQRYSTCESDGDQVRYEMVRFYRNAIGNPDQYQKSLSEYNLYKTLLVDLIFELTRAINYILEKFRQHIDPLYRLDEGLVLVGDDPFEAPYAAEYKDNERKLYPYPGIQQFQYDRKTRDIHCVVPAG
ncbi:hypothetical protein [Dictyobacter arantiisoli]|uniref:Uncharacterized protein n=1 Tax=Dictyobacter arantiisoli TaxID=2014874 RepID=A0A5A5TH65_9CHLR|nr:hypothetical protein [Dictyobacter arantiisoli]GCF10911.1 hypothetical protein KDI_44750 [Dictyobacter arantiisoli]